ncbi:MAG: hypothetical protein KBS81_00980 [Spirochaetales bacterium]|nr:hypothetical protein [Candidatus Physcosoma equi]
MSKIPIKQGKFCQKFRLNRADFVKKFDEPASFSQVYSCQFYDCWNRPDGSGALPDGFFAFCDDREVAGEPGLRVTPVSKEIFSLERLSVDGHYKKGKYVSTHMHLNLTYLLEADEDKKPRIKEDENSGAQWFSVEDALSASTEEWMVEHIYKKLVARTKEF